MRQFIIVFGSAAAWTADKTRPLPRDIDVAFGGDNLSAADAEYAAGMWAAKIGLPANLPVDCHRFFEGEKGFWASLGGLEFRAYRQTGTVLLPVPFGKTLHCVTIRGDAVGVPNERTALTSLLRLSEDEPTLARWLICDRRRSSPLKIMLLNQFKDWMGWEDCYTGDGPEALLRALSHTSAEFLAGLGELGKLLTAIKAEGSAWAERFIACPYRKDGRQFAGGANSVFFWSPGSNWPRKDNQLWVAGGSYASTAPLNVVGPLILNGDLLEIPGMSVSS